MKSLCTIALWAVLTWPVAILADAGHDHDEGKTAPARPAAPRFESHSELFELVGVLEGAKLTLYLDRYRDNAPVEDAKIEVESGSFKGEAIRGADGAYALPAEPFDKPGRHVLTLTVTAGSEVDLLTGALEVPSVGVERHASAQTHHEWQYWPLALGIAALAVAMFFAGRLHRGARSQ
jgi:hypothetical protein